MDLVKFDLKGNRRGGGGVLPFDPKTAIIRTHSETSQKAARHDKEFEAYKERFASRYGWTIEDSMRGQHWSAARESIAGVEQVLKMYPGAQQWLRGATLSAGNLKLSAFGQTKVYLDGRVAGIKINDVWFRDKDTVDTVMRNSNGFHPEGSGAQGVSTHEAGHALVAAVFRSGKGAYKNLDDAAKDIVKSAMNNPAVRRYMKKNLGSASSTTQLRESLSRYAAKNDHETIAEAVSDYANRGSQAHVFSRAIHQELKKRLR